MLYIIYIKEEAEASKEFKMYDYRREMAFDVEDYIKNEMDRDEIWGFGNLENMESYLDDCLFVSGITGNDNGSYYCNAYKAHEALFGNEDLAREAYSEFGDLEGLANDLLDGEWEKIDVSIRCYLLNEVIHEVLFNGMYDELTDIMWEDEEEDE